MALHLSDFISDVTARETARMHVDTVGSFPPRGEKCGRVSPEDGTKWLQHPSGEIKITATGGKLSEEGDMSKVS